MIGYKYLTSQSKHQVHAGAVSPCSLGDLSLKMSFGLIGFHDTFLFVHVQKNCR